MKIHIAQKGDTMWKIANEYGVDFQELLRTNSQLKNPDRISPGVKIKLPAKQVPLKSREDARLEEAEEKMQELPSATASVREDTAVEPTVQTVSSTEKVTSASPVPPAGWPRWPQWPQEQYPAAQPANPYQNYAPMSASPYDHVMPPAYPQGQVPMFPTLPYPQIMPQYMQPAVQMYQDSSMYYGSQGYYGGPMNQPALAPYQMPGHDQGMAMSPQYPSAMTGSAGAPESHYFHNDAMARIHPYGHIQDTSYYHHEPPSRSQCGCSSGGMSQPAVPSYMKGSAFPPYYGMPPAPTPDVSPNWSYHYDESSSSY
ncbi:SafA/ExsA family spore coat assembly protein [Brevibacillus sp. B_LB10_24]|uniref:SafA/ExsA family spore coat assembly protein n=1 Tax=Brevibacillus sp. B_LB10_24 TaxID=3380645 RepID=UPI0038B73DBC